MQPVVRVITTDPEVIPLNTYGKVGCGISASGAATIDAMANKDDLDSVIANVAGGVIDYPADALQIKAGIGQTITISQYGS